MAFEAQNVISLRASLQDYTALPLYFCNEDWARMLDKNTNAQVKVQHMYNRALSLGLINPSEPTMRTLTSLHLMASECAGEVTASPAMKFEAFRLVKTQYRRHVATTPRTWNGVLKLCVNPDEFKDLHPEVWQTVFGEREVETDPPIDFATVQQLSSTVPMRSSNISLRALSSNAALPSMMPRMSQEHSVVNHAMMQQFANVFLSMVGQGPPSGFGASPQIQLLQTHPVLRRVGSRLALEDQAVGNTLGVAHEPALQAQQAEIAVPPEAAPAALHLPAIANDSSSEVKAVPPLGSEGIKPRTISEVTQNLIQACGQVADKKKKTKKKTKEATEKKKSDTKKKAKEEKTVKKKKKGEASGKQDNKWKKQPPKDLVTKFKDGCKRCRQSPGCTPSCWAKRGY